MSADESRMIALGHKLQEDDRRDAARWRALLASHYMRLQGWSGFDRQGNAKPNAYPDSSGKIRPHMHFGIEFTSFTNYSEDEVREPTDNARHLLTEYVDAIRKGEI